MVLVLFNLWARLTALMYGGEGINIPLQFMPTRVIAPLLRRYGADIGHDVRFSAPLTVHNSDVTSPRYYQNLTVGNHCYFGRDLFLDLQDRIVVEDHVTISHRVMILTHTDAGTSPLKDTAIPTSQGPVIIGEGAYIGAHTTILEGVEIGSCAIIGAGALVNRSIPSGAIAVGVPAKVSRHLPREVVTEHLSSRIDSV